MKRIIIWVIVVIAVVAVAGFAYLRLAPSRAVATTSLPTATVQSGNLVATVNSAGNIASREVLNLNFEQSGTVGKVNAKIGDRVKAGQVLAELDTTDLELALQNAQINLEIAQNKLTQTKNPSTQQDIDNARAAVESAKANLAKVNTGATATDLNAAQSSLRSAQAAYDAAVKSAGTSSSGLVSAATTLEKAQATLQQAQAAYDKIASRPDAAASSQALTLQTATSDYNSAKASYEALAATSGTDSTSKVQSAKSALDQAKASLAKLQTQVNSNDVKAAEIQVQTAENNLAKLLNGPDAATLNIAENSVHQAEIALKQAQRAMDKARIVAPFDGVVAQVNINPGQSAASATASTTGTVSSGDIQLADMDHLQVVVNLGEVDSPRVKEGQTAQLTFDALPDVTLDGKVVQIWPSGVQTQGVVNYPVTVELTDAPDSVKPGMSTNVNIVVDERDNVLTVPNRAVRTQGRQKLATVLFEGQQIQVPVQTGLNNDTVTEIVSGLKEGDTVLLTTTTTQTANRGGFGGGPPPGGVLIGR